MSWIAMVPALAALSVGAEAAELPRAPAGYRVGNAVSVAGFGLVGLSAAAMVGVGLTCNDPVHGCGYSYVFLLTMGVVPGLAAQPVGAALGYRALRKNSFRPNPWGMYTMAVGGSLLVTTSLANAAEASDLSTGLAVTGLGLVGVGAIGQVITNVVHFEGRRATVGVLPLISDDQRGIALAVRW